MKDSHSFHGLPALPADLFLIIICFLDPIDIVRCRRVSTLWNDAFTNPQFLRAALVSHHGRARDVRRLKESGELDVPLDTGDEETRIRWIRNFDRVSSRYHSLRRGKPQSVTRIDNLRFLSNSFHNMIEDNYIQFEQCESEWTYDSGFLVYADPGIHWYILMDVESSTKSIVPFSLGNRTVRRIRLQHNVLIIEWAAGKYIHTSSVPRVQLHFVSAFDIIPTAPDFPWLPQRQVVLRSEWKLQSYGCDLYPQHRFFSTHTSTHYAVYILHRHEQGPNGGLVTSLMIWDIQLPRQSSAVTNPGPGPTLLKIFYWNDLEFYGIRWGAPPSCWNLKLDADTTGMVYFTEIPNRLMHGNDIVIHCPQRPRLHQHIVGIPILGAGPRWEVHKEDNSCPHAHSNFIKPQKLWQRFTAPTLRRLGSFLRCMATLAVQKVHDEVADISFWSCQWTDEQREWQIWISGTDSTGKEWKAQLDQSEASPLVYTRIHADERWIVGQAANQIHILRF